MAGSVDGWRRVSGAVYKTGVAAVQQVYKSRFAAVQQVYKSRFAAVQERYRGLCSAENVRNRAFVAYKVRICSKSERAIGTVIGIQQ
jgi:CelD/BcsL family acetyltransferase involved in cellulose biosynthesis